MRAKHKFILLLVASLLYTSNSVLVSSIGNILGYELYIGMFGILFYAIAITGFTNGLNLIDGIDALASFISIVILFGLGYIGYKYDDSFIFLTSFSLIFILCGFLVFNLNPAKIFMGDSGSLVIGFMISVLAIESLKYIQPSTILMIAALPIIDTIMVMTKRLSKGISPFKADKNHIHHIVLKLTNKNIYKTVFLLTFLQIYFTFIGLGFKAKDDLIILILFIFSLVLFYNLIYIRDKR